VFNIIKLFVKLCLGLGEDTNVLVALNLLDVGGSDLCGTLAVHSLHAVLAGDGFLLGSLLLGLGEGSSHFLVLSGLDLS
jgi:hypothetical protein